MSLVSFFGTWILQCHAGTHSSYIQQLLNTWCFGIYYSSVTFMCCVIITLPSRAVAKYCNQHVCVCVCLSTRIPPKPHTCNLYQIFCACCLWPWLGSPPAGWWNPKWKGKFCGFFSHWQCIVQQSIWDTFKNGWTDRDVVLDEDSGGPMEPCIRWGADPQGKVAVLGVVRVIQTKAIFAQLCKKTCK